MREIKFRVWDNNYKYMNYKVLVGMWGKESLNDVNYIACSMWIEPNKVDYKCEPHWAHFEPYMEDIYLMQYTGLKDKNGKEIYEGDIVCRAWDEYYKKIGVVEFSTQEVGSCGCCYEEFVGSGFIAKDIDLHMVEVIGNIYENPELLGDD